MALFGCLVAAAALADVIQPHDAFEMRLELRNQPPGTPSPDGGIPYLLGTDPLGRDVLSRLLHGARTSLAVGLASVAVSGTLGVTMGLIAGYYGGKVDEVISRVVDLQMSLPSLLVALFVLFVLGPSFTNVILVLALTRWMVYARVSRALALSLKEELFIEASQGLGASHTRIMFRHLLPNMLGSLLILSTLEMATMILTESSLSFLGLGIQPPDTSWGLMLADGRKYISSAWWLVTFPGLAILFSCLLLNGASRAIRRGIGPSKVLKTV